MVQFQAVSNSGDKFISNSNQHGLNKTLKTFKLDYSEDKPDIHILVLTLLEACSLYGQFLEKMCHFQILSRFLSQTIDDELASPLLPLETTTKLTHNFIYHRLLAKP